MNPQQFQYTQAQGFPGLLCGLPYIPITLSHGENTMPVSGLVDSGSTVNVIPYDIGIRLGLTWGVQHLPLDTAGTLWGAPAYAVILIGEVKPFPPVRLVFAWSQKPSNKVPLILGQMNFFQQFRVTFDGCDGTFEVEPYS